MAPKNGRMAKDDPGLRARAELRGTEFDSLDTLSEAVVTGVGERKGCLRVRSGLSSRGTDSQSRLRPVARFWVPVSFKLVSIARARAARKANPSHWLLSLDMHS